MTIALIPLLLICCVGPGLLVARWLHFSPLEKLCGAFAASFVAIYLASLGLFCLNAGTWAYWVTSGLFAAMGAAGWPTARLFLRNRHTREALAAFSMVLGWEFLHLAMVRHYGGGNWAVDWREHFERTQYFLHQFPNNYLFVKRYLLPARPPMMNAMAAFFCRQVGLSFEAFSVIFLFLNAWAFIPCCLFLRLLAPRRRGLAFVLAVLFMLNPSILQNTTLTVTKALTAGLVVLGVCYYLRRHIVASGLTLAAAILVHYSAGPFAAAIGLHYLYTTIRERRPLRKLAVAACASAALLGTWFVYSISIYGWHVTFLSNAAATGMQASSPSANLARIGFNLFTSLVPHPFHPVRDPQLAPYLLVHNLGDAGDYFFLMSQTTLPMMIGLTGGVIAAGFLITNLESSRIPSRLRHFWIFYLIFTYIVGIAVNSDWNPFGCAHITLQSLAMMGLALLAANLARMYRAVFVLLVAGLIIDYCLGILLHFDRQSYIYPVGLDFLGRRALLPDPTLGHSGFGEYGAKLRAGYVFLGDHWPAMIPLLEMISVLGAAGAILLLVRLRAGANRHIAPMIVR